jgi:pyruvate,water dikinase
VLAIHRRLRELDKKLDEHIGYATERLETLKTSVSLKKHIAVIMGYTDVLDGITENYAEAKKIKEDHEREIEKIAARVKDEPEVLDALSRIAALREEVALKMGLKREMDAVRTLPDRIRKLLESRGFRTGKEHYIQTLARAWPSSPWLSTARPSSTAPRTQVQRVPEPHRRSFVRDP